MSSRARRCSRLAVRGVAPISLQGVSRASYRDAATIPVSLCYGTWLFLPRGCYTHIGPPQPKFLQDSCLMGAQHSSIEIFHNAVSPSSTNRLKLPRYSSTLRDKLGGSKIERIFSVTSVSSLERDSKQTTPDMKPSEGDRQAIRRSGTRRTI